MASQATGYSQLEQLSSGLDVPLTPPKWEKEGVLHDANLDASQSRLDMPSDLQEPSFGYEPGLGQEHSIMSSEAPSLMGEDGIDEEDEALAAARRREEHDRLVALLEETRQESEELTTANARCVVPMSPPPYQCCSTIAHCGAPACGSLQAATTPGILLPQARGGRKGCRKKPGCSETRCCSP